MSEMISYEQRVDLFCKITFWTLKSLKAHDYKLVRSWLCEMYLLTMELQEKHIEQSLKLYKDHYKVWTVSTEVFFKEYLKRTV